MCIRIILLYLYIYIISISQFSAIFLHRETVFTIQSQFLMLNLILLITHTSGRVHFIVSYHIKVMMQFMSIIHNDMKRVGHVEKVISETYVRK